MVPHFFSQNVVFIARDPAELRMMETQVALVRTNEEVAC